MKVDGTTQAASVGSPPSKGRDGNDGIRSIRRENRLAADTRLQAIARFDATNTDTFQHIEPLDSPPPTYANPVASDGQVPARASEDPDAANGQPYQAQIVDLETAVNADGLPLLPEGNERGVFSQEVRDAYEATRNPSAGSAGSPVDHIDSLG